MATYAVSPFERSGAYNFWTMNDTANDDWGNNNGTASSITYADTTQPTFITQSYKYGKYAIFAPSYGGDYGKYIALTDSAAFKTQAFTIHGWIKSSSATDQDIMHSFRNDGGWYGWHLRILGSNGKLNFEYAYSTGTIGDAYSTAAVNTGNWVHFGVTVSSTAVVTYINFLQENSTDITGRTMRFTTTHYPAIGVRRDTGTSGSADPFSGNMKDLAFVPYVMTAGDFKKLSAQYKGRLAYA